MKPIYLFLLASVALLLTCCSPRPHDERQVNQLPRIYPDYVGVTIPAEIAPLNFAMTGTGWDRIDVTVTGADGRSVHASGSYADFDIDEWHALTAANRGSKLTVSVCAERDGQWSRFTDFPIYVSRDALGEWGLTYRRIAPGYEIYSHMGIYQRDLSTFDESAILENTEVTGMCINCHTSNRTDPSQFTLHVRGANGGTLIQQNGRREWLDTKTDSTLGTCVYPYWHPSGRYCAYSTNMTRQGFHAVPHERIEVFDFDSDVQLYCPATHQLILSPLLQTKAYSENCPVFSPDGRTLYFITARTRQYPKDYRRERYNLCSISFDAKTGRFGNHVDTLFRADRMGKSATWPRPSYDGRYLLFTLADYGYFSIWHNESEQWIMDLRTGKARPLTATNSRKADSYHNWSLNSRWIVFTSRRGDGLYTCLYLAHIGRDGRAAKPFLLPQRDPAYYYAENLHSFNTPDFTLRKVQLDAKEAGREIRSQKRTKVSVR